TRITAAGKPIRRLRLEPEHCLPLPEALAAIRTANIITIGPGSLYTSLLPNLLVARVAECIGESRAVKIYIGNLMTQPGETDGYTARQHIATVKRYAPEIVFDYIVVNDRLISDEQTARYAAEGAHQIGVTDHQIEKAFGAEAEVRRADLLDEGEKVRHSPDKLARVITACYEQAAGAHPAVVAQHF
ncbi:MAG: 2-phospho-L-lactate transferase CofD family protein, partial [Acidobacteriota bacterium]|nr:2-phospho-L-lactate transferase CofD family protein [Acidobacteriota bacterium]